MKPKLRFRQAKKEEVSLIVAMLAHDPLGATRERAESPLPQEYYAAFDAIDCDPNNELIVALLDDQLVGVLQLTFIPYLTYQGGWRMLIEGVRVAAEWRAQGIGRQMFEWAIRRAGERSCRLVQLTTNKARPRARQFYERLGFVASHEGLKLELSD